MQEEKEEEEFSEVKDNRKILNFSRKEPKQAEANLEEEYFPSLGEEESSGGKNFGPSSNKKKEEPKKGLLSKSTKETASSALSRQLGSESSEPKKKPLFTSKKEVNNALTGAPLEAVKQEVPVKVVASEEKPADFNQLPPSEKKAYLPEGYGEGLSRGNFNKAPPSQEHQKKEEEFQKALNFGKKTFTNAKGGTTSLLFQV